MTDLSHRFVNKVLITSGWSSDKKYIVTDQKGEHFLLRVSDGQNYEKKSLEFALIKQVSTLGIPMCLPLDFGRDEHGVYSLYSWIEGKDLRREIAKLSETKQYQLGIDAGKTLRKIHSVPAPDTLEAWDVRFLRKADNKIKKYLDCAIQYDGCRYFIEYITNHHGLLKNRPQTFQHGDYHIGNMMIDNHQELQIIDFDRYDFGDPWEEFNRIVWCAKESPLFASGMVNGYFNNEVPREFWDLLAFYIATNALSALPWAIPFGQGEIDIMLDQIKQVLFWYDNMTLSIPKWYRGVL